MAKSIIIQGGGKMTIVGMPEDEGCSINVEYFDNDSLGDEPSSQSVVYLLPNQIREVIAQLTAIVPQEGDDNG